MAGVSIMCAMAALLAEARDWQGALGEGDRSSLDDAIRNAETVGAAREWREFILQHEYDTSRSGEPANWRWVSVGIILKGETREACEADARRIVANQHASRFVRGYRLVERVTATLDWPLAEIATVGGDS